MNLTLLLSRFATQSVEHPVATDPAHSTMMLEGPDVKTVKRLLSAKRLHLKVLKQCAYNLIFLSFCLLVFTIEKKRKVNGKVQEKNKATLKNLEVGCLFDFCTFSVI